MAPIIFFFHIILTFAYCDILLEKDTPHESILEITSGALTSEVVTRSGNRYTEIRLEGFEHEALIGAPEVPYGQVQILVPDGKNYSIRVNETSQRTPIALSYPVAFAERIPIHDGVERLAVKEPKFYKKVYGKELFEIIEDGYFQSERILTLRLNPIYYDPINGKLEVTENFKIEIRFTGKSLDKRQNKPSLLKHFVLNQGAYSTERYAPNPKHDFIIAHSSYEKEISRLVDFKISQKRTVKYVLVNGKTASEIKQMIRDEYQSGNRPSQTLLIGNPSQIPSFRGNNDNTWTDYDYLQLGSDSIPDISLGRIPAASAGELRTFLDKMIGRENDIQNNNDILLTAGRDVNLGCPSNVTQVGENIKTGSPDIQIIKKYKTTVSTDAVIQGYNDNPNIIVYDGHGVRRGMTEIPLMIDNLNRLTNISHPIILDIACLNANWSSSAGWKNFTSEILFLPHYGAAGIMSSGGSGYGHGFFRSIGALMAEARKKLSQEDLLNEIGQIILAAKIKHGFEDRSFWNYYGDPTSRVWVNGG